VLPGRIPIGISLDLHPIRAVREDALDAAAAVDAETNRIFLEPVLHGEYPAGVRAELLPGPELIQPGDMRTICAPIDFLGLNYYSPHYVRLGDWDDLRVGESPLAGHPGARRGASVRVTRAACRGKHRATLDEGDSAESCNGPVAFPWIGLRLLFDQTAL
jgi:beta-glucosidase/6-phospho-beta-glucosidase/beta-galactosidase